MNALRIYFRQHQLTDIDNANQKVVVDCSTGIARYIPGTVDSNWVEMTEFTEGLEAFQSTWDSVNQGNSGSSATNAAGSNYDKGISASFTFWGDAFDFIESWLLTTKCQILNSIDVRIDDVLCGKSFRLFEIKCDNLKHMPFADGSIHGVPSCRIDVQLREQDLTWHCVHKTFIWDDWNGFATMQDHPTFLTCIEPRPRLMNSVRLALMLFYQANPAKGAVDWFTGRDILDDGRRILNLETFTPAPLIRDYIDNVAGKCGLNVDTIFHRVGTFEYMACLFHPLSGEMYENDKNNEVSPSTKFIFENRWNITLAELLDKLKLVYASEWYVTPNNTVVFKPIKELVQVSPIYDFTIGDLPIRDLEYTFSGSKKPAYGRYQYQPDGSDLGSQEVSVLYNDLTDFDGPSNNPMLEGELNKSFEFAPTAFIRDGRTKDYINLLIEDGVIGAYILVGILAVIAAAGIAGTLSAGMGIALTAVAVLWVNNIRNKRIELRRRFVYQNPNYTGAVRLVTANQTMTPRILIWDGIMKNRAKVVQTKDPAANTYYNPDGTAYGVENKIGTDNPNFTIFNYPAYFDSKFTGNLFDRFHDDVDNPLKSLDTNQDFEFETDLCCDAMDLFGLWENDFVKIGYLIVLERRPQYTIYGRIENIAISYEDYTITIKGKVIKNLAFLPPVPWPTTTPPPAFIYFYGDTILDTTGTVPSLPDYITSVNDTYAAQLEKTGTDEVGASITVTFDNTVDKVLFIDVPGSEEEFTTWSVVGDALQQNQPIDPDFTGSNVIYRTIVGSRIMYITRIQTTFGGPLRLSR